MSPAPHRQPGGGRIERDARRHSDRTSEVSGLLSGLLDYLSGYQRRQRITDGQGRVWELPWARSTGSGAVATSGAVEHPLLCVNATTEAEPRRVRVVAGTVGGLSSPFSPGDDPPTYVTAVIGSGFVYATLMVDASPGYPVSLTMTAAASVPADTLTAAHLALASTSYTLEDGLTVASFLTGSQDYVRCNSPWDSAYYAHSFTVI